MNRPALATASVVADSLRMALIEFDLSLDTTLHVDHFGLSVGAVSVGLPVSCTADTVLVRYLDLVRLLDRREQSRVGHEQADLAVLADATHLSIDAVERRLERFAA